MSTEQSKDDRIAALESALLEAAKTFREYEAHHRAKLHESDVRFQRAERNRRMAENIEALVGRKP